MGGPVNFKPWGIGTLPSQKAPQLLHAPIPSIPAGQVPVELIVGLTRGLVQDQPLGLAFSIIALLGDLRAKHGLLKATTLWPIGIGLLEEPLPEPTVAPNQLVPSFVSKSIKMLIGIIDEVKNTRASLTATSNLTRKQRDRARMRLRLTFPPIENIGQIQQRIKSVKGVDYVEIVRAAANPSVVPHTGLNLPSSLNLKAVHFAAIWARHMINWPSPNPFQTPLNNIAVLDSGADETHPSLYGAIDYANSRSRFDLSGHGTAVAGIIAARGRFATDVPGLNHAIVSDTMDGLLPKESVYMYNVFESSAIVSNSGTRSLNVDPGHYSLALNLIADAYDPLIPGDKTLKRIQVINLSLGSSDFSITESRDIKRLLSFGVKVVAASGNHSEGITNPRLKQVLYPAALEGVIAVGATAFTWPGAYPASIWERSNRRARDVHGLDICAPGEIILSTIPVAPSGMGVQFSGWLSGTSMAAPFVTASIAVLLSKDLNMEVDKLLDNLSPGGLYLTEIDVNTAIRGLRWLS